MTKILQKFNLKVVLSVFIIYHLIVMVMMPFGSSVLQRRYSDYFLKYANTIFLNQVWTFFSPDPATIFFIQYTVYFSDTKKEPETFYIPDNREKFGSNVYQQRNHTMTRLFLVDPIRIESTLGPWACAQHPGAESITVEAVTRPIPNLESVSVSGETVSKSKDEIKLTRYDYNCTGAHDEVIQ